MDNMLGRTNTTPNEGQEARQRAEREAWQRYNSRVGPGSRLTTREYEEEEPAAWEQLQNDLRRIPWPAAA